MAETPIHKKEGGSRMNSKISSLAKLSKKALPGGITFVIAGLLICTIGFAMAHFDLSNFEMPGTPKWYLTVHVSDNQFSLGIRLSENAYVTGLNITP